MRDNKIREVMALICWVSILLGIGSDAASATVPVVQSKGQTVYAATYSYVLMGSGKHRLPLTATLVIRNTDLVSAITVTTVDYRDSKGKHLRHYVEEPITVGPLVSTEFIVKDTDTTGGHSPSFIIRWEANEAVNAPIVEVLMIGGRGTQGISFIGRAWVLEEAGDTATTHPTSTPLVKNRQVDTQP